MHLSPSACSKFPLAGATLAYWASSRALKRQGTPLLRQTSFRALITMARHHPRTRLARAAQITLLQHHWGLTVSRPVPAEVIPFPRSLQGSGS